MSVLLMLKFLVCLMILEFSRAMWMSELRAGWILQVSCHVLRRLGASGSLPTSCSSSVSGRSLPALRHSYLRRHQALFPKRHLRGLLTEGIIHSIFPSPCVILFRILTYLGIFGALTNAFEPSPFRTSHSVREFDVDLLRGLMFHNF